jgi:hypothetical protein
MIPFVVKLTLAVALYVKFEGTLKAEIKMSPSEGSMLIKLKGLNDPKFKSLSKEYDKDGLAVSERHT